MGYDSKYGKITTEFGNIPEDEPVFILRGQDKLADFALREYQRVFLDYTGDREHYVLLCKNIETFEAWPKKKLPD